MASSSILDRFTSPRNKTPILPMHDPPRRPPSEYQLDELHPRPDLAPFDEDLPRARQRRPIDPEIPLQVSTTSWNDRSSSAGSSSKRKPRAMFAGPPPPITASMMVSKNSNPSSPSRRVAENSPQGGARGSRLNLGSLLLNQTPEHATHNADSVWRGLRRQEKALERDIQDLLDVQAAGLVAGSGAMGGGVSGSDADTYSDAGSSTPTGTFYSTATSKSRMMNSLHVPTRSTPDGNVIPVRQPARNRPRGLRSSRDGLRKSMAALVNLKREEDAHIDAALSQRKQALVHLDRLGSRRVGIQKELHILEEDEEEPLGKELRDLGEKHDSLNQEIRHLEERLVGMRNRRRWLRDKMDHVRNKKEAGLSGYRGALRDVDAEVTSLMQRPPIQPLDSEMLGDDESGAGPSSLGGPEFLRLIPERRTADMARTWWEGEIVMLERRKSQIGADRQALEEGGDVWREVMALVTDFEASLRELMKASVSSSSEDKQAAQSQEDTIRDQLPHMDGVIDKLEQHMQLAEEKHWNLLICAIGAELDAFKEAQRMLKSIFEPIDDGAESNGVGGGEEQSQDDESLDTNRSRDHHDESDNEVPSDLLVSKAEDIGHDDDGPTGTKTAGTGAAATQGDSEDEVPPEFLAQHDDSSEA